MESRIETSQVSSGPSVKAEQSWLPEYQLRVAPRLAGYPEMTRAQVRLLDQWGILGPKVGAKWPPEARGRLLKARALEADGVRFLPRRVIRLRADGLERFPIPTDCLRRAMVEMVSVIKRPAHQLALVHSIMCWLVEWQRAEYGPPATDRLWTVEVLADQQRYPREFAVDARLPAPPEWASILNDSTTVPDERLNGYSFAGVANEQYRWDQLIQTITRRNGVTTHYTKIAPEERIVLLTVRHLALVARDTGKQQGSRREIREHLLRKLAGFGGKVSPTLT
jgi:hypothetical protein